MKIVFVGTSGFPDAKTATVSRLRTFAHELVASGAAVLVLNNLPGMDAAENNALEVRSVPAYPGSRLWRRLRSVAWELRQIFTCGRDATAFHVYTQSFVWTLVYLACGWWCRAGVVLHYVEMRSEISGRKGFWKRWNDRLLDGRILRRFDAVIAISTRLRDHLKAVAPEVPCLLVPPVCDFDAFAGIEAIRRERPYFVYCGSIAYREVIDFILASWECSKAKDTADLVLVIGGMKADVEALRASCSASVDVQYGLEYGVLLQLYKGAIGHLIPLRSTVQDLARFPQKCCEYAACGGPILSTNLGEIGLHFSHGNNALLAERYSPDDFAGMLNWVVDHSVDSREIAHKGTDLGKTLFHAPHYREAIVEVFREAAKGSVP